MFSEKVLASFGTHECTVTHKHALDDGRFIGSVTPGKSAPAKLKDREFQISGNSDWVPEIGSVRSFKLQLIQLMQGRKPYQRPRLTAQLALVTGEVDPDEVDELIALGE